ncbi:MAG: endonuclease MutS2, partial [Rectinema sp.]|nr:endonuclease MutS2 [Rectinema sp.]
MVGHEHSLQRLDFYRLRSRIEEYCLSPEGRALMRATLPCTDEEAVRMLKDDLDTLVSALPQRDPPPLVFPEIGELIPRASKDGTLLEIEELYALGVWARSCDQLFGFLREVCDIKPSRGAVEQAISTFSLLPESRDDEGWAKVGIEAIIRDAPTLGEIREIVFGIIDPAGTLRDLPRIRSIREAIRNAQMENRQVVERMLSNPELQDALQSTAATERDGRTVFAVKVNFKGRIKGIAHEFSSTGQTVFIEPFELVEKNNRIIELESRLNEEIRAVLREATAAIRPLVPMLVAARKSCAAADVRLARALQLIREGLCNAAIAQSGLHLFQARHPLLGKKAVPIDVDIPEDTRVLIITGPNTGGKTVSLKTIGLLVLLNQYGAGIPAFSTSSLALFDGVFADIGDEQSIDQSLSTFSGHMKIIADIVQRSSARSLVLLDELGAGTDPEEGCAIAMALLDNFLNTKCLAIVTTHHGILKNYGYTKPGCLNASMEFDAKSLSPTYRMRMGVPGESRAVEIALQTGLPETVVAAARGYLDDERTDYSALIRSLGEKQRELDRLEQEKRRQLKHVLESRRDVDLESLRVRQRELELRRQGVGELRRLLSESRKTFENLVREIRESGRTVEQAKQTREFLKNFAEQVRKEEESLERLEVETEALSDQVAGGASVTEAYPLKMGEGKLKEGTRVLFRGREARVLRVLENGQVQLLIGALKIKADSSELRLRAEEKPQKPDLPTIKVELAKEPGAGARAVPELDVRGMRLAEAIDAVQNQIDAASPVSYTHL